MFFSNFWSLWPHLPKFGKILPKSKCEETFFVKISELRGWVKKKYTNGFKSGGNILGQSMGQSASKC